MGLEKSTLRRLSREARIDESFRVDRSALTEAENSFVDRAYTRHQSNVHRPSWPDFLIRKDGKLAAVEVKSETDSVSANQARTFDLLERWGMPVYVWDSTRPHALVRWKTATNRRNPGRRKSTT